ncbi:heme exporter protein CcmB [Candidatus Vecturithrix granuli]|uniref:Heme exporter protein B n=1 Tax=Vecturithrix granuli TaxID=1499967 RepID=A0A081BUP4_VECG1|nr:heme exporter protein CcmB [Candidatus Vecturithrix granuli]
MGKKILEFFRTIQLIVRKDLLAETRTRESFPQMAAFAVLLLVIINITLQIGTAVQEILPGILWIILIFAGILGLNHSLALEHENDCLHGLRACPVPRCTLYLGKIVGNFLYMALLELILWPVVMALFNLSLGWSFLPLAMIFLLGTLGFVGIGTLFAFISTNTRMREVMLPLLLFPIILPILLAAVKSTGKILAQKPWIEIRFELQFLIVFDLVFLGLALLLFEYIIENE